MTFIKKSIQLIENFFDIKLLLKLMLSGIVDLVDWVKVKFFFGIRKTFYINIIQITVCSFVVYDSCASKNSDLHENYISIFFVSTVLQ